MFAFVDYGIICVINSIIMPEVLQQDTLTGDVLHQWSVREYERHDRGRWWFVLMFVLGFVLVIYGLFSQNFLFSLIIILFGIILFLQSHQDPIHIEFAVSELGIVVGTRFYSYDELESFYIIYKPPAIKMLFIETKSFFRPLLRIPLDDQNPVELRHTLQDNLDENLEKEDEPISDTFARNWKLH